MANPATVDTESLNSLIAVLHDGMQLHEKALDEVSDSNITQISNDMISVRRQAIDKLRPLVKLGGKEPTGRGTVAGNARALLAKARAVFGDRDKAFAAELARVEEATVSMIETCIKEAGDRQVAKTLAEQKKPFAQAAKKLHKLSDGAGG